MDWLPIALSTAVFAATTDAITKARLSDLGTAGMALARVAGPIFILAPLLLFIDWPKLDSVFWRTLSALLPLETAALLLYMKALKESPLSVTVPFLAFTPAFMILTGRLVLGERPTPMGLAGIWLIVAGSYCLFLDKARYGLLSPFKAAFRHKGPFSMLIVAMIYSLTSVLGKLAIQHSEPVFFAAFYFVIHGLFCTCVLSIVFRTDPLAVMRTRTVGTALVGISQSAMVLTHMWAISIAPAAYLIAVKRLSVLLGVLIGCLFFKEKGLSYRMSGAALMVAGVFVIALA